MGSGNQMLSGSSSVSFPTFPSGVSAGRLLNLPEPEWLPPSPGDKYLLSTVLGIRSDQSKPPAPMLRRV